jgi:hypothetical protein
MHTCGHIAHSPLKATVTVGSSCQVTEGGKRRFAASASLSVLPREAVIQTCGIGPYKISE